MGTTIDVIIQSHNAEELMQEVFIRLFLYNNRFSANDNNSELSRINQLAGEKPLNVHEELFDLITLGKLHSIEQPSNLNIALGPFIQSWRIGFKDAHIPDDLTIKESLSVSNPEDIIIDKDRKSIYLAKKGMKIDLGALAKGYIADKIINFLRNECVDFALINLGGNVLFCGKNTQQRDGLWRIGIQNPYSIRGGNIGILNLKEKSVVTSGIYERYLEKNNKRYHHIFNKETGYPIETEMLSLTIISDLSVMGEVWTTRLFGLPNVDVMTVIEKNSDIEGILISKNREILISSGIKKIFQLLI